jgi:hypothetical protein
LLVELVDDPADLVLVGADHRRDLRRAHTGGRGQQDLGALAAGELGGGAGDAFELATLGGRQLADKDRWLAHRSLLVRRSPATIPSRNPIHLHYRRPVPGRPTR